MRYANDSFRLLTRIKHTLKTAFYKETHFQPLPLLQTGIFPALQCGMYLHRHCLHRNRERPGDPVTQKVQQPQSQIHRAKESRWDYEAALSLMCTMLALCPLRIGPMCGFASAVVGTNLGP